MTPRFPFLHVRTSPGEVDALAEALFCAGASGVEERDDHTMSKGPGGGRVALLASFETVEEASDALDALRARWPAIDAEVEEVVGDDWRDKYKEHFAPFRLTSRVTVAPPWVPYVATEPGELVLLMDPGRAFGTGLHATTALVAEALERHAPALGGARVLDVGTGSGVLALVALLLGAAHAVAIDNDPDVIPVALANAELNGLAARMEASVTPLARVGERFVVVVANIEAVTLTRLVEPLLRCVSPGGTLVLSGVLEEQRGAVTAAYEAAGANVVQVERRGDGADAWVAIVLRAPGALP